MNLLLVDDERLFVKASASLRKKVLTFYGI